MILLALLLFTVGAIISGLSKGFAVMLVGRCIQGVGGGGLVALTYVIVTDLVKLRERGKWFGLISMHWAIGSVCGPVVGVSYLGRGAKRCRELMMAQGAFAEKVTWVFKPRGT